MTISGGSISRYFASQRIKAAQGIKITAQVMSIFNINLFHYAFVLSPSPPALASHIFSIIQMMFLNRYDMKAIRRSKTQIVEAHTNDGSEFCRVMTHLCITYF